MQILKSNKAKPTTADQQIADSIEGIDPQWLQSIVERISIPRSYEHESENNRLTRDWVEEQFQSLGFRTMRQGEFDNIVAWIDESIADLESLLPTLLVGAHYDTKPGTPGADDNASAVAAMLGAAKAVAQAHQSGTDLSRCVFVAFNREEDGLLGSYDFVNHALPESWELNEVHILEMVGYCDHEPGSQGLPKGLPIKLGHDRGDFLAIVANRTSNSKLKSVIETAASYVPEFPVWGLKVFFGMEKRFSDLRRSDHAPFWDRKIPAFMWTDTSEFRNPNYHLPSDTPDTIDYEYLHSVTRLLTARVLSVLGE